MPETIELDSVSVQMVRSPRVGSSPRILIIDDEAAIRESLDTLLTLEGFTVTMAADGAAGR